MKVTATATRSGGWWALAVADVPGVFTQSRRLDQAPATVADAVALMLDLDPADVEVEVVPDFAEAELVQQAQVARAQAEEADERAAVLTRAAVRSLVAAGYTVRDVGAVLGISPQRVSQLSA